MAGPSSRQLRFTGHAGFRRRLILSLLSKRPLRIDGIRPDETEPGLLDCEVSFLRLLERITHGTTVEISFTGTSIVFVPGSVQGGHIAHTCPLSRAVGWFLEPLLALAPFCKKELVLTLRGVTTNGEDPSVDTLRIAGLPTVAIWLGEQADRLELRVVKRGHPPGGGGECVFRCPSVRALKGGVDFTTPGSISKVRGVAHSVRVSPQIANRLVSAARNVLDRFLADAYIYTDVCRGDDSGHSPGFALTLLASSTSTALHSAEVSSRPSGDTPEDVGEAAAWALLQQISRGGCIDHGFEWIALLMLALGPERDVGRIRIGGPLEPALVSALRDLEDFFGVVAKIKPQPGPMGGDDFVVSIVAVGYSNQAKGVQ